MPSSSWSALFHGQRAAQTLLLNLGVAVHAVDVFIITTVLPSVVADIGGAAFYTWSTMLYVVASIIGTASSGLVKSRLHSRHAYIAGALVFLAGSAACAVAPHMTLLLVARTAQGLGGGLLVALSHGMVSALYPEVLRPRVFASISGVWGMAALLGPTVGGVFAELGWWRGAFWAAVPVTVLLMGLAWWVLPAADSEATVSRFPWFRLSLLGAGVFCVALSGHVTTLWTRFALIGMACVLVWLTFYLDARTADRLLPSQPLSLQHAVGTAYWMLFLLALMTSQFGVFMPLVVQVLHGVSPLGAGYFAALRSLAWTAAALCTAGLQGRAVRVAILVGPLVITGGSIGQALLVVDGPLVWLGVFVVLTGVGIGICFAHISSWTIAAARAGEADLTAASIPTMRSLGFAFGAATAGVVANIAGFTTDVSRAAVASLAIWVYGLCSIAPAVVTLFAVRLVRLYALHSTGYSFTSGR